MSLFPLIIRSLRPSTWMDHHLRMMRQMDAVVSSAFPPHPYIEWRDPPLETEASLKNNSYVVRLDVKSFAPKEISVKTIDNNIIVEGKHEEKSDDKGFISRHFVKTFYLPMGHEPEDVVSTLSNGVLTIMAPNSIKQREVPITEVKEEKASN